MSPPSKTEKSKAQAQGNDSQHLEGEENEWKFREPYKVHENNDGSDFNAVLEGGCHCGRVRYQLSREKPLDAKFCHCGTCQRLHGAPFQWAAIFHKGDINFTHGHHDLSWYDSAEKTIRHKLPCKVSCSYCRSPIMDEGRNMILLFPSLIEWGEGEEAKRRREAFRPSCHMFYAQRCVDVRDALPKWEGMNMDSKLMEEGEGETKIDKEKVEKEMAEKKKKKEEEEKKENQNGSSKHKRDDDSDDGEEGKTRGNKQQKANGKQNSKK